jgi:hypothetical protein
MLFIYLFICSLFYDTVSTSDSWASLDWLTVNNELKTIWKEAVVVQQ